MLERKAKLVNKAFRQYLWASVLTVAATQIANIVDAMIVGNLVGADGLAAVNLSKPVLQAFFAISCFYVASSTMLAGMAIGKGDREKANRLFTFSLKVSLTLGLLFTAAGLLCFGPLSSFLCPSEKLRPLSDAFLRITLISAAPQLLMLTIQQYVTMDGEPKRVSAAVITGNLFNIVLDIVFIKYCGWGIAGAAAATCTMYIVCILMVLPHFRRKDSLRLCPVKMKDIEVGRIATIGLPLFFSTVLLSVQFIGNNYVAGRFLGDDGLVALAVCMQLFAFSMIILTGTLRTIQPVGAILKGMDDSRGMLMLVKRGYRFMAICFAIYAALLILFPTQIAGALGVKSGSGLLAVKAALPLFSLHIVLQGMFCLLLPVFQFYDRKGLALLLSIAQTLLPMLFFLLLRGNWAGFVTGQLLTGLAILVWGMLLRRKDRSLSPFLLIPMKDGAKLLDITVQADTTSLSEAVAALRSFLAAGGAGARETNIAAVCTEEFVNNIICHGHASSIDLAASVDGATIRISIHDDGAPFNPAAAIKSQDAKIGLGLTLADAFCNEIDYKYIFNQNMVRLSLPC